MTPPPVPAAKIDGTDFKFSCPFCQQHLACEDKQRGTQISCPACSAQISIPALLGLAVHAPSTGHAFGNYCPPK